MEHRRSLSYPVDDKDFQSIYNLVVDEDRQEWYIIGCYEIKEDKRRFCFVAGSGRTQ